MVDATTDTFAGYERFPKVIEAGIRVNMTELAAKLGAVLSKPAR